MKIKFNLKINFQATVEYGLNIVCFCYYYFDFELIKLRSSRSQMSIAIFTGHDMCLSFLLIKVKASKPATLLKRDSNTGVFQ